MRRISDSLALVLLTAWVGGMWAIGFIAAPTLFNYLDRPTAGFIAGKLFTLVAYMGLAAGLYLLFHRLVRNGGAALKQMVFWLIVVMLALTVAGHFGIQPILESLKEQAFPRQVMESAFRDRFATWHGISNIVYVIQSVLGALLAVSYRSSR